MGGALSPHKHDEGSSFSFFNHRTESDPSLNSSGTCRCTSTGRRLRRRDPDTKKARPEPPGRLRRARPAQKPIPRDLRRGNRPPRTAYARRRPTLGPIGACLELAACQLRPTHGAVDLALAGSSPELHLPRGVAAPMASLILWAGFGTNGIQFQTSLHAVFAARLFCEQ